MIDAQLTGQLLLRLAVLLELTLSKAENLT